MADITTSLHAAMLRAAKQVTDTMATEGLVALKRTLDDAGLPSHDGLKSYQLRSSVTEDGVQFEIVLDSDAVVAGDERTRQYLEGEVRQRVKQAVKIYRTYVMTDNGPQRRDVRQTYMDRMMERGIVIRSPRSMEVTPDGKLRIAVDRMIQSKEFGISFPHGRFQGIMREYEERMIGLVSDKFVPELQSMILGQFR